MQKWEPSKAPHRKQHEGIEGTAPPTPRPATTTPPTPREESGERGSSDAGTPRTVREQRLAAWPCPHRGPGMSSLQLAERTSQGPSAPPCVPYQRAVGEHTGSAAAYAGSKQRAARLSAVQRGHCAHAHGFPRS